MLAYVENPLYSYTSAIMEISIVASILEADIFTQKELAKNLENRVISILDYMHRMQSPVALPDAKEIVKCRAE